MLTQFYVDYDELLVFNRRLYGGDTSHALRIGDSFYSCSKRPNAEDILDGIRACGEVLLLTASTRDYLEASSHYLGLQLPLKTVSRAEYLDANFSPLSRNINPNAVLVEHVNPFLRDTFEDTNIQAKMAYLGISAERVVLFPPFFGQANITEDLSSFFHQLKAFASH